MNLQHNFQFEFTILVGCFANLREDGKIVKDHEENFDELEVPIDRHPGRQRSL